MILILNEISINTSLEKTFAFLSNPENLSLWNYYIKSVRRISSDSNIVGSEYHQIRERDEQFFKISQFEENKSIEFISNPGSSIYFKRKMIFSKVKGETLIEDHFELDTNQPLIFQKFFSRKIKNAVKENLAKLKTLLETGQVTLQNGKVSYI